MIKNWIILEKYIYRSTWSLEKINRRKKAKKLSNNNKNNKSSKYNQINTKIFKIDI